MYWWWRSMLMCRGPCSKRATLLVAVVICGILCGTNLIRHVSHILFAERLTQENDGLANAHVNVDDQQHVDTNSVRIDTREVEISTLLPPVVSSSEPFTESFDEGEPIGNRFDIETGSADIGSKLPADLNCDIHLAPNGSLPIVALASCPGSGNTWVRYLLEQATGIYTGSVYHDKRLQRGGLLGEMDEMNSGRTIAIKTHTRTMTSGTELFTSAIVLFRNPFRAVISHYNFKETRDHRGVAKWEANMNTSRHWHNSSKKTMDWWRDVAKFWLTLYEKPILVVHYEDLLNDTVGELTRMLDFLHVPQKERRIDCVRNKLEGGFHRHSNVNQELQFAAFTPEMRSEIKNFTDWTSSILTQRGYKPIYHLNELEV